MRGTLAIAAAGLGTVSVAHSLAYTMRGSAPAQAHALAPWDGRITALLSEQLSAPNATPADRGRADELAQRALRQDPTAVAAVATLGINAQVRDDTAAARRIFAYSEKLSRRDLRTRLWANEDAVARGDIPGALRNYDIALRTSRIAPDLFFPVLVNAIGDENIRVALARTLAGRPPWGEQFIMTTVSNAPDSRAAADLLYLLRLKRVPLPVDASSILTERLIREGYFDDAWRFYATFTPGVKREESRNPKFAVIPGAPTPFDWMPATDGGIIGTIQQSGQDGFFDFSVPTSLSGPLLQQTQILQPGGYTLTGRSSGIEQGGSALLYWVLACAEGRELGRVTVPNSSQNNGRFNGHFVVPTNCPVQKLQLVARPSDALPGVSGRIDEVQLYAKRR
ncbi:hypothetical protein [Sphingomonas sp. Leaf62]|uniref:hypothetical protein n=1 Tax=Sphingomonas sp. Leaf62 TaxID=1736228 RepID=UPI0012E23F52|nr:hypothetical protein [Sphingomonas sp. Leaf62]